MDTSLLSNGSTIVPPDVAIREVSLYKIIQP